MIYIIKFYAFTGYATDIYISPTDIFSIMIVNFHAKNGRT